MDLQGKIIDFLGDSITEGYGVTNIPECRFDHVIMKEAHLKATYNYGIGGTRLAHQSRASEKPRHDLCFCGRAYDLNPEADIIVVFGGTNDYDHGDAPFGTDTDTTPATFCGAVEFLMKFLLDTYPNAQVVFMTPARRYADEQPSNNPFKKEDKQPLHAYGEVIKQKGQKYGIPVLDLYKELPINPNLESERHAYTTDGLHFNDEGHGKIADCLLKFLKEL